MTWDPTQYLKFDDFRTRPALDLLGRVPSIAASEIWDLGCGTGAITAALAQRWPDAATHGLDSSPEMLERAEDYPDIDWVLGDIDTWSPDNAVDLIFSNAALHWIGGHEEMFPKLAARLAPGGVLAVQMPHNHQASSHQKLYELARSQRWSERVGHLVVESPVADPEWYHELLASSFESLDVWETVYQQPLTGPEPVAEWTKGSVMRPYLEELGADAETFFAEYAESLRQHYPTRSDGVTLFGFRRLFIVGRR